MAETVATTDHDTYTYSDNSIIIRSSFPLVKFCLADANW